MTPRAREPGVTQILVRAGAALGGVTLLVGALHMPFARGLLMRAGGCPLASARMTASQRDSARHMSARAARSGKEAPARPALSFALDTTTAAEVHAWAQRARVDCEDARDGLVKCTRVSPRALGLPASARDIDELALGFDPGGKLVNVTTLRLRVPPDEGARVAQQIASSLYDRLGGSTRSAGSLAVSTLAQPGVASLATRSYRYADYVADLTALNLPSTGLSLREHYMSTRD